MKRISLRIQKMKAWGRCDLKKRVVILSTQPEAEVEKTIEHETMHIVVNEVFKEETGRNLVGWVGLRYEEWLIHYLTNDLERWRLRFDLRRE